MPKIVAHGTELIGFMPEWAGWGTTRGATDEPKGAQDIITYNYALWCTTDDGKGYVYYVDLTPKQTRFQPDGTPVPGTETTDEQSKQDVQQQLDRARTNFESDPSAYGRSVAGSPEAVIDQLKQDWAGMADAARDAANKEEWGQVADWLAGFNLPSDPNNPDREHAGGPGKCWCGRTHPPHKPWQMECRTAPVCWCRKKHCGVGVTR